MTRVTSKVEWWAAFRGTGVVERRLGQVWMNDFWKPDFKRFPMKLLLLKKESTREEKRISVKKWNSSRVVLIISFFNVFLIHKKNLMKFRKNLCSVIFSRIYYKFASYR